MTWIGGIFSNVNMSHDELRNKLAVMMQAAFPTDQPSAVAYPHCICCILDNVHGPALAQVSIPIESMPSEHIHPDYDERPALIYDGHLYDSKDTDSKLSRGKYTVDETTAKSLTHLLAELPGNLEEKVKRALLGLDGDYALAVSDIGQIVISRDSLGTKPLYFAENDSFSAFASNMKPLWKIGSDEVRPVRAGTLATLADGKVSTKKALPIHKKEITIKDMAQAVDEYQRTLCPAVHKRLAKMNHVSKIGVLLSGGVDSCLLAKLVRDAACNLGMEAIAYTAGLPDSLDVKFARAFARELGMKHKVKTLSVDEVEEYIPEVIDAIEDGDFVQVETGIGLYAAIDMAGRDSIRVIFSGQGPDELWGGYNWYPKVLAKDGRQELVRRMWDDFSRADIETLDRENKIAMVHGVELFFPYLDRQVVDTAMSVGSELKVMSEEDRLGKHPHRQLAMKTGIPEKYANRGKFAIQHGTGIHGVLDDIAKKNGFDHELVKNIGYKSEEITSEKRGSSARYGYRYIDKKLWQVPQHVQFFFQVLAYSKGLLNKPVRDRVEYFLEKAGILPKP
jgi:asparagine synthase (glutamine-hydrolysing)